MPCTPYIDWYAHCGAHGDVAVLRSRPDGADEARKMWASTTNIAGQLVGAAGRGTSYDTMGQMNQAFRNIVNMLHGVRDGLIRDANNYETQEQASKQL